MQGTIASVVVLVSEIFASIEFTAFIIAFCDIFAVIALFILRRKMKNTTNIFRVSIDYENDEELQI